MSSKEHFRFSNGVILYPLFFVILIWLVFWFEVKFGYNFTKYGIYPLKLKGLRGVIFSPFIHSGIQHLYHNSMPLFVLSAALFYFYKPIAWKVIGYGILLSGLLTWFIGRPAYHIGASGLIYVLFSFTFFKGVFAKHYRLIALSLMVIFLYGSMVMYALPIDNEISWEGHLSGLVTGFIFALIFKRAIAKPKKFDWEHENYNEEEDEFLKHFDKDGNFIEKKPEEELNLDDAQPPIINYTLKKEKD